MADVSLVVPTYNEARNIEKLAKEVFLEFKKHRISGELIVVDDNSPDGTKEILSKIKKEYPNLKVVLRPGKLGLASAVLDGFAQASGRVLGVMDADFSHPTSKIHELALPVLSGDADIAVGSRYTRGGGIRDWPRMRKAISRGATVLARPLTRVSDPVSGFFFIDKEVLNGAKINPRGFKILLEILVRGKGKKVVEVPFTFTDRKIGKSKLNSKIIWIYIGHVLSLYKWRFLSKK